MTTSPPLVESKHTCYKLITSLSTRARNVNALDTCHTFNWSMYSLCKVCSYACIYLITLTRWECCPHSQNKNNTCSSALSLFSGKEQTWITCVHDSNSLMWLTRDCQQALSVMPGTKTDRINQNKGVSVRINILLIFKINCFCVGV